MNTSVTKNYWWIPLLSGLVLLFFGIWFLLAPLDSFKSLSIVFGIVLLLSGALELYVLIKKQQGLFENLSYIWGGILNILLGILLIANPETILVIISFIIGFWLIFKGGEQIKRAFQLRKNKNDNWKGVLGFGGVLILAAVVLLWHPEIIGFTIALWTSVAFIMVGVFRVYLAFGLRSLK